MPKERSGKAARANGAHRAGDPLHASAGRSAALAIVAAARERQAYTRDLIEPMLRGRRLSREDRAFATMLALGVAASSGTLDEVIDRALDNPHDVKPNVRDALRLSTFEIVFLGKADYVAVDQGVELVRSVAPRAAGLANAVLRRVARLSDAFPFGDPETDEAARARLYAFPLWLSQRIAEDRGDLAAMELMESSNGQAPLYIAVNAARARDEEIAAAFAEIGCELVPGTVHGRKVEGCYRLEEPRALSDGRIAHLLSLGKLLVSDAASQAIARIALPQEAPASFLEVGSGRATKTILLQSNALRAWGRQMDLAAIDNYAFKGDIARERAHAYGIDLGEMIIGDATKLDRYVDDRLFDAVFIDAPCSGLGTLRRHPEIRWRIDASDIATLANVGRDLLRSCARHVAVGGQLVYATCTVTREENECVVESFMDSDFGSRFELEDIGGHRFFSTQVSPGSCDAHFAAKLVRVS